MGHPQVEEHHIEIAPADLFQSRLSVSLASATAYPADSSAVRKTSRTFGSSSTISASVGSLMKEPSFPSGCASRFGLKGRVKVNLVPLPSSLETAIWPPWATTISRAMASPNPAPPPTLAREPGTR